jgi:serine phosphatase RsbU (regulator of sigma subunit)/anti-sigma regulatory factor (Ser/Thr protein kinase)
MMDSAGDLDGRVGVPGVVREVFDSMPLLLVGMTGPEHRVGAVNLAYRAAFGRDKIVGMPVLDVFPEMASQQLREVFDQVLASGVPQVVSGWRAQIRNPVSGKLEEHYIDCTLVPRRDAAGTVVGLNLFGVDTTEEVLDRQRMREEAAQWYKRAPDVVTALRRQLLPEALPLLPSVRIAGSYLPASRDDMAGGDWFDAIPVSAGRVALVVGDVVGHGMAALAAMGQLRAVLHERLDGTGDVLAAVAAADRMARRIPGTRAATVCVALLDPGDGTLTWCSAGHPPPLIAGPDSARFLPASGQGLLGTGAAYATLQDRLEAGEVVLLYSDGTIERPGRPPAAATAELAQVTSDAVAGRVFRNFSLSAVDRACTQTVELLVQQTGHADDIILLAAQRRDPVPPLRLGGPGVPVTLGAAREILDAWLGVQEASEQDKVALAHAVVELVTNALQHGRPDAGEPVITVTAELRDDGEACLIVADNGQWREQARPGDEEYRHDHGFGLAITASLVDHLHVEPGPHGTTATVRRRLSRPAWLLPPGQASQAVTRTTEHLPDQMLILAQPGAPGSRIAIHGSLDATSAEELGMELDRLTLGGTHELVVDLTAVTHLASAAVTELYRTAPGGGRRHPLMLYAPAGSTAHHVLSLVSLPHTCTDPHPHPQPGTSPAGTGDP